MRSHTEATRSRTYTTGVVESDGLQNTTLSDSDFTPRACTRSRAPQQRSTRENALLWQRPRPDPDNTFEHKRAAHSFIAFRIDRGRKNGKELPGGYTARQQRTLILSFPFAERRKLKEIMVRVKVSSPNSFRDPKPSRRTYAHKKVRRDFWPCRERRRCREPFSSMAVRRSCERLKSSYRALFFVVTSRQVLSLLHGRYAHAHKQAKRYAQDLVWSKMYMHETCTPCCTRAWHTRVYTLIGRKRAMGFRRKRTTCIKGKVFRYVFFFQCTRCRKRV